MNLGCKRRAVGREAIDCVEVVRKALSDESKRKSLSSGKGSNKELDVRYMGRIDGLKYPNFEVSHSGLRP